MPPQCNNRCFFNCFSLMIVFDDVVVVVLLLASRRMPLAACRLVVIGERFRFT